MKFVSRMLAMAAMTFLAGGSALAADGVHPVIGTSLTFGGETLATVRYTNGNSEDVKSGGLIHLFGGVEYQKGKFALQANIGYHVDDTSASDGKVQFSRVPVEVLGFWQASDKIRVGGGVRKATGAKVKGSGAASSLGSIDLDADTGLILQAEYFFDDGQFSAFARFVQEDYKVNGASISGNHTGLGVAYRF